MIGTLSKLNGACNKLKGVSKHSHPKKFREQMGLFVQTFTPVISNACQGIRGLIVLFGGKWHYSRSLTVQTVQQYPEGTGQQRATIQHLLRSEFTEERGKIMQISFE